MIHEPQTAMQTSISEAADEAAKRLILATWVLVGATIVLAIVTVVLVIVTARHGG